MPISFSTFDFPRTENRVKRELAFKNPKTGSTSILRWRKIEPAFSSESFALIYSFCRLHFSFTMTFQWLPSFDFVHDERNGHPEQFSHSSYSQLSGWNGFCLYFIFCSFSYIWYMEWAPRVCDRKGYPHSSLHCHTMHLPQNTLAIQK